ncbi:hypothetical protein HK096_006303, partial [Nowakowskiella sp. JEL0078]
MATAETPQTSNLNNIANLLSIAPATAAVPHASAPPANAPPGSLATSNYSVFAASSLVIDPVVFLLWLNGLSIDKAALYLHKKAALLAQSSSNLGSVSDSLNVKQSFIQKTSSIFQASSEFPSPLPDPHSTMKSSKPWHSQLSKQTNDSLKALLQTQYRIYEHLELTLHYPSQQAHSPTLSPSTKRFLIESYYSYDPKIMRELLGKKLSTRTRKDLDDIAERTQTPLGACRRTFDNLKRIARRVDDSPTASRIESEFLLPPTQSHVYTMVLFISRNRLDTSKRKLAARPLALFVDMAAMLARWLGDEDGELDNAVALDARDARSVLFASKEVLEEFRGATVARLNDDGENGSGGSGAFAWSVVGDKPFRVVLKNVLGVGVSVSVKEFRDVFINLLEKVVEPCEGMGWGKRELDAFLDACLATWIECESIPNSVRRKLERGLTR